MLRISGICMDFTPVGASMRSHVATNSAPLLTWRACSDRSGAEQSAYRLVAGKYDSGWVNSLFQRAQMPVGTLPEGEPVDLQLTIRDDAGIESETFSETIYNAARQWEARWIGIREAGSRPVYLKKRFFLPAGVRAARLYHCGLGYGAVWINRQPLDDACLDPSFTDYSKRISYVFMPVHRMLHQGENEILAVIAPGWRGNFDLELPPERKLAFRGDSVFCAMLEWQSEDGTWHLCATDETWEAGFGPIRTASLFHGEQYDAAVPVMENPRPAQLLADPGGKLEPMVLPPITQHSSHAPKAVWVDGDDAVVLDFGQNMAGILRVPLERRKRGKRIVLTHSEELTEDGKLFRDPLRGAQARDEYRFSGDSLDLPVWQPQFTYHGFRYARIEGVSNITDPWEVRAVELRNDVDKRSFFRCGNALITRLHELCEATERANQHSILTDCPQRDERMGWMNDATVRFDATPYHSEMGAFFPKIIRDIIDTQNEKGEISCTAPFVWGNVPADPVCSAFLVAGMQAWLHSGNDAIVQEAYPAWDRWEQSLLQHSENWIVNYSYYGDWAGPLDSCQKEPDGHPGAASAVTPGIFMSTGYSYLNCRLLERFARILGFEKDAVRHARNANHIRDAMLKKWYDPESGSFATGSQGCLSFALYLGLSPEPKKTALRLHEALEKNGGRLTTGNLCSRYILDALSENGWLEDAWQLMTRTEYPSLGYMLQQEATTIWERFELMKFSGMNSHNHPMYAAADYWMYGYLAGLKPSAPGWREFEIHPYMPKELQSAQATVETPMGMVSVRWVRRYGKAHLQAQIPFGARAHICFCGRTAVARSGFFTLSVTEDDGCNKEGMQAEER